MSTRAIVCSSRLVANQSRRFRARSARTTLDGPLLREAVDADPGHTHCRCLSTTRSKGKGTKGSVVKVGVDFPKKNLKLAMALQQVETAYGRGAVMQLGSKERTKVDVIRTGSLSLDHAVGVGGLPKGRVVEVYGPESSGKTTVALHAVAQCQKAGGTAVFIDAEHALDTAYAEALGVDISNLYLSQPDNGEQALDIVDTLVKSSGVDMVVIDSVAALVPKAELEGEMGDSHVALQARLMSQALRKLTAVLHNTNCTLIFINQIRQKIGVVFGSPDVTTGGMALRFYSSVRLEVRKGQPIKSDGQVVGTKVKIKVAKNKLAPPFGKVEIDLMYGKGFDAEGELLDLGVQVGLVSRNGAWYGMTATFGTEDTELADRDGPWLLGQGREKSKASLVASPLLAEKLGKMISERLATGETSAPADGDIPSDDPSLFSEEKLEGWRTDRAKREQTEVKEERLDVTTLGTGELSGYPPQEQPNGILLEPGVASPADLYTSVNEYEAKDVAEDVAGKSP